MNMMTVQRIKDIATCEINNSSPLDVVCVIEFVVDNFKHKYNSLTMKMEMDMLTISSILKNMDEMTKIDYGKRREKLFKELKEIGLSKWGITELCCWDRYGVNYDKRYKH